MAHKIEKQNELLSKKDKVIKEMGSLLLDECIHNYSTLDELIEAVYKKVEEENDN